MAARLIGSLSLIGALVATGVGHAAEPRAVNPFFALCVGYPKQSALEEQLKVVPLLAELGYAGMAHIGLTGVPEMREALDRHRLRLVAVYSTVNVDPGAPGPDPRWKEVAAALGGRDAILWLGVVSKQYKPSSTEGDARAVELLGQIADWAQESGLRAALYPHRGFYAERIDDLVRLVRQTNRPNLGLTFNLCHFLAAEDPASLQDALRRARPHLMLATINGTSGYDPKNRGGWVQPLEDRDGKGGSFAGSGLCQRDQVCFIIQQPGNGFFLNGGGRDESKVFDCS